MKILLDDAINRDRTTARRAALFNILSNERFLTREQLLVRVEGQVGSGCFGESAWEDTFYRDMQLVKKALRAEGYKPAYSRSPEHPGYYLLGQSSISSNLLTILDGSVVEVDSAQIVVLNKLTAQQRFQQGCSISNLACRVVANRIRNDNPQLTSYEAQRLAIQRKDVYEPKIVKL